MLDTIIIGAGPAGLSAAINLKARNRNPLVLGRAADTTALYKAHAINNDLGNLGKSGKELMESYLAHAKAQDIEIRQGRVAQIMPMDTHFGVNFENDYLEAKTIILATGSPKGKKIEKEAELVGKGVSYCATCDGMFFKGKDVIVVSDTKEGEEDADFLADICNKVYFLPTHKDPFHVDSRVEILSGKAVKVLGENTVEGLMVDDKKIDASAVFFIKGVVPMDNFIFGIELTETGSIKVNNSMETNIKGLYAAGDCIGWPLQLSNAIGEGLIAGQAVDKFLRGQ